MKGRDWRDRVATSAERLVELVELDHSPRADEPPEAAAEPNPRGLYWHAQIQGYDGVSNFFFQTQDTSRYAMFEWIQRILGELALDVNSPRTVKVSFGKSLIADGFESPDAGTT